MKVASQLVGSGKIGNVVYAKVAGECVARQYTPEIANPKTVAQTASRSKLKLMSQLSASLADSIAIRKEGLKSARNIFIQKNYDAASVSGSEASINLNRIQLTKSNKGMIGFNADRSGGSAIAVELNENASALFDKVVYTAYRKDANQNLVLVGSQVSETAGVNGLFAANLPYSADAVVVYAYGIKITSEAARVAYGNMQAPSAEQVAKLYTTSSEVANGSNLTQTAGLTMLVGEDTADSDDVEHLLVSVSASGNGSVSGGGRFVAGQTCTLHATPVEGASFVAWKRNSVSGETLSTSATYSFEVEADITIVGVFQGGPAVTYLITANSNPAGSGTVTGAGQKEENTQCTLVATPAEGKIFDGWYENDELVSNNATYSFTVTAARTLTAQFADEPESGFSNVRYNGTPISSSGEFLDNGGKIAGSYTGESTKVVLALGSATIGQAVTRRGGAADIVNGSFELTCNYSVQETTVAYLVACHAGTGADEFIVDEIFDYSFSVI